WEWATSSTLGGAQISGGGDNAYVVNSPGNAARAITVAAHVNRVNWASQAGNFQFTVREQVGDLATFSSSGPTRPVRNVLPARQDPFTGTSYATGFPGGRPNPSWGYGKLDVQAALAQAPPALTAAPGANSPTGLRLRIGANAALQFAVAASTAEGDRLDSITV